MTANSLVPGRFGWNFRQAISKKIFVIDGRGISCEIALRWMSLDFTDDQSTLVQVMAWCCQATIHYLNQYWLNSLSACGVTRPQWVNSSHHGQNGCHFADNIFKCTFMNEKFYILIRISLKFVPQGPIDNIPASVRIMAWRRLGYKLPTIDG